MKKVRAGIVGLGRIAALYEKDRRAREYYHCLTHAGSFVKHPAVEVVCGADIDGAKLKRFGRMFGVSRTYLDYNEMLRENSLDLLSICTHPDLHHEIIRDACRHVKVIFCEKPFTSGSEEIEKVIALKNIAGTRISINLYREYDSSHLKVRDLLNRGKYGRLDRVNCYYGKGLRNMGTHLIGYLMGTLGKPVNLKVFGKKKFEGVGEFTYDVYFEFRDSVPVIIQACDFNNYRLFEIDFICERGRVQILDEGLSITIFEAKKHRAESGAYELVPSARKVKSTAGDALCYAVGHLVDLVRDRGKTPLVSPERYLDLQLVIEEIERQGADVKCHLN